MADEFSCDVQIEDNVDAVLAELATKTLEANQDIGEAAEAYAKAAAPVRTGWLRDHISHSATETGIELGIDENEVPYAGVQEAKHNFLHDAMAMHENEYADLIKAKMSEIPDVQDS